MISLVWRGRQRPDGSSEADQRPQRFLSLSSDVFGVDAVTLPALF
jgi:hypothetical protein